MSFRRKQNCPFRIIHVEHQIWQINWIWRVWSKLNTSVNWPLIYEHYTKYRIFIYFSTDMTMTTSNRNVGIKWAWIGWNDGMCVATLFNAYNREWIISHQIIHVHEITIGDRERDKMRKRMLRQLFKTCRRQTQIISLEMLGHDTKHFIILLDVLYSFCLHRNCLYMSHVLHLSIYMIIYSILQSAAIDQNESWAHCELHTHTHTRARIHQQIYQYDK